MGTWIEVLVGAENAGEEAQLWQFLMTYQVLELTPEVTVEAIRVRRERRLKLPDAIIFATPRVHNVPLITRNTKDFQHDETTVIVPTGSEDMRAEVTTTEKQVSSKTSRWLANARAGAQPNHISLVQAGIPPRV